MEDVKEKEEEIKIPRRKIIYPPPIFPDSYHLEIIARLIDSLERTMGHIGRAIIQRFSRLDEKFAYLIELMERSETPPGAFEFDEIFTSTSAIGAGSFITVGSYTIPENTSGYIKRVGFSIPTPVSAANTSFRLQINKATVRGWNWTHNASYENTGAGRGTLALPSIITVPVTGGDLIEFMVSAVLAEASASYGVRLKGWFR